MLFPGENQVCRRDSATSRPSRMTWMKWASGSSLPIAVRWPQYIGVLSPHRRLPKRSA